jgi:hypothetical protein
MRLAVRIVAVTGLVALMCAPLMLGAQTRDTSGNPPPAATGTLTLAGKVVLAESVPPVPVRRARVVLSSDLGPPKIADTDTDGAFRFDSLPAGNYRVVAEKPGFVPLDRGPARGIVRPIPVTLGPDAPGTLTIQMQRAGALEGVLLTDKGEPVANLIVAAVKLQYGPYGRRPGIVRQATTDDLGRFRVHTLPAGDYYLDAAPDPMQALTSMPAPDQQGFALSFFPGTSRIDEARVLSVGPGQDVTNLEFRITAVRMALVTATIVDSSGKTPNASGIRIQRIGAPPGEVRGVTLRPGSFQFPSVPPGEYWLLGTARPSGGETEFAAMRIVVAGQDLKDVTLTTAKAAAVNGRVEVEGSATLPANLQVVAYETDFEVPATQPPAPSGPVQGKVGADGSFQFSSMFGNRLFRVDKLPPGWALKSVFLDAADVTDTPVDPAAAPQRALRIVLTNRTATISGSLEGSQGGPTAGRVVVFSQDTRRWGLRSRLIQTAEVLPDGRYSIGGLLAGRYFLIGVEDAEDVSWNDPEVLSRLQATAIPLTLTEGQKLTLTLVRR